MAGLQVSRVMAIVLSLAVMAVAGSEAVMTLCPTTAAEWTSDLGVPGAISASRNSETAAATALLVVNAPEPRNSTVGRIACANLCKQYDAGNPGVGDSEETRRCAYWTFDVLQNACFLFDCRACDGEGSFVLPAGEGETLFSGRGTETCSGSHQLAARKAPGQLWTSFMRLFGASEEEPLFTATEGFTQEPERARRLLARKCYTSILHTATFNGSKPTSKQYRKIFPNGWVALSEVLLTNGKAATAFVSLPRAKNTCTIKSINSKLYSTKITLTAYYCCRL